MTNINYTSLNPIKAILSPAATNYNILFFIIPDVPISLDRTQNIRIVSVCVSTFSKRMYVCTRVKTSTYTNSCHMCVRHMPTKSIPFIRTIPSPPEEYSFFFSFHPNTCIHANTYAYIFTAQQYHKYIERNETPHYI